MAAEKYTVVIYPDGMNKAATELVFNSQDEKNAYIRSEATYCRREQASYLSELFDSKLRDEKKASFYRRRVEFAKKSGFKPDSRGIWKRSPQPTSSGPHGVA